MKTALVALLLTVASTASAWAQRTAPRSVPDLVVIARLVEVPSPPPGCGTQYFASVMRYEVVRVLAGRYPSRVLFAAHGCMEMSRREYGGPHAGSLTHFTVGDLHRLELQTTAPGGPAGPSLIDLPRAPLHVGLPTYWTIRADSAR